jgi:ubiquinone/menaquinone biosynthesis C-methylase UbiE
MANRQSQIRPGTEGLCEEEHSWTLIGSDEYDGAVYRSPILLEVYDHELQLLGESLASTDVLIEVGCGTGKFCLSFVDRVAMTVGVDISTHFLAHMIASSPNRPTLIPVVGDASNLDDILRSTKLLNSAFWSSRKVLCCVMNTLGIMSPATRPRVLSEMVRVMQPDGSFFLAVFNADYFEFGVQEFYRKNPDLCGQVEDGDIDVERAELRVASSGYYSHWFSTDELKQMLVQAGLKNYAITKKGVGIFVRGGRIL